MNLFTQPPLGTNAIAVADQQHSHEQFRNDRRSARRAVECRQFETDTRKVNEAAKAAVRGFVNALRSELMYEKSATKLSIVHLPTVNTPQFDWARDKFVRKTALVLPIYQPEAVSRAVLRAVDHALREYWLGFPTVKAIVGQMLVLGIVD